MLALAAAAWLSCLLATAVLFVCVVTVQVLVRRTSAILQTVHRVLQARSASLQVPTSQSATTASSAPVARARAQAVNAG